MARHKRTMQRQEIIACLICGSCISQNCGHSTFALLTKAKAAAIAIRHTAARLIDMKCRAAGDEL